MTTNACFFLRPHPPWAHKTSFMTRFEKGPGRRAVFAVSVLFFLSGATALSAEVVLNKLLTYVFGSSHLSTSTVLAAYMAGLSAGAWLFGRRARGFSRPVRAYAWLELSVGAFYALLPLVFGPFQRLGISLAAPLAASPASLTLARFGLSFALVFAPTLMMGGTLPTLVSAFRDGQALRQSLPLLYAVNTLGAALGTLVSSYVAIPALGLDGALYACAGVNLVIAAGSLLLEPRIGEATTTAAFAAEANEAPAAAFSCHLSANAALFFAFAQGAIAFVLEVVWFHLIGTVIGVTTYAFALMLFSILLGIGIGSLLLPPILRRTGRAPLTIFVWAMLFVALSVAASLRGWDGFSSVVDATPTLRASGHFWAREAVRLGYCLVMLLPTTLALGMSLPALAASVRSHSEDGRHGAWVGRLFASNTLGTIAGSIGCGFFLLGRLGSERILQLGAALAFFLSVSAFTLGKPEEGRRPARIACGNGRARRRAPRLDRAHRRARRLGHGSPHARQPLLLGAARAPSASRVGWLREDAQSGFITVMVSPNGQKTLRTNGKYEGNSDEGEFQDLFALLGGLYVKRYERAVMVGLGPARTLSVLHAMPFRHIEAVEYSPAIIAAATEQFPEFSAKALGDTARVRLFCDDGRNHVQLSTGGYDYVAIAISGAAFAGVGNIYSREFFQNVSGKLGRGRRLHVVDPGPPRLPARRPLRRIHAPLGLSARPFLHRSHAIAGLLDGLALGARRRSRKGPRPRRLAPRPRRAHAPRARLRARARRAQRVHDERGARPLPRRARPRARARHAHGPRARVRVLDAVFARGAHRLVRFSAFFRQTFAHFFAFAFFGRARGARGAALSRGGRQEERDRRAAKGAGRGRDGSL